MSNLTPSWPIGRGMNVANGEKRIYSEFRTGILTAKRAGGAATGTAGDQNLLWVAGEGIKNPGLLLEYGILGTQTILAPVLTSTGMDIGMDQTNTEGVEITNGITARSPMAFTVGTDRAFFLSVTAKVVDASGCNPFVIGFRKAEAYNATIADYADYAYIGIVGTANPNTIKTVTEAAGGGATTTDTTNTWADAATKTLKVSVSAARAVTYLIDGVAPTVTAAFTFDSGEVVVPFFFFLQATTSPGIVELIEWISGLDAEA